MNSSHPRGSPARRCVLRSQWLVACVSVPSLVLGCGQSSAPGSPGPDGNGAGAATNVGGSSSLPQGGSANPRGGTTSAGAPASGGSGAMVGGGAGVGDAGTSSGGAVAGSGSAGNVGVDPSAELFDAQRFPRFELQLPAASVAALRAVASETDPKQDTYVEGDFSYDNGTAKETVVKVGVRLKGTGSFLPFDQKPAFKIKFDEFTKDQRFRGLARLTLNNNFDDASFIAERVAYDVYRAAKVPAPRCNSARVYVNGEFYGVYTNIETEDKHFLKHWFASNDGNLYEKDGYGDFKSSSAADFQLETNEAANDRSDLTALLKAADAATNPATFVTDLAAHLDMDELIRFFALEAAVNQWDTYAFGLWWPHNFRLYGDPTTKKFSIIPWGHDLSMKPSLFTGRKFIDPFELTHQSDDPSAPISAGILFQRCLTSPSCRASYVTALENVVELWKTLEPEALAATYYAQIKAQVYADTRKRVPDGPLSNAEFDEAYAGVLAIAQGRAAALTSALAEQ